MSQHGKEHVHIIISRNDLSVHHALMRTRLGDECKNGDPIGFVE
jgi:hypothetical protein